MVFVTGWPFLGLLSIPGPRLGGVRLEQSFSEAGERAQIDSSAKVAGGRLVECDRSAALLRLLNSDLRSGPCVLSEGQTSDSEVTFGH